MVHTKYANIKGSEITVYSIKPFNFAGFNICAFVIINTEDACVIVFLYLQN